MLFGNADTMFLPIWRGGRLLFFTNITTKGSNRLGYVVAAATESGATIVARTGRAPLNAQQLEYCQKIADDGPALQAFFASLGGGNLDQLVEHQRTGSIPYPEGTSRLIYTCLYLDFLRKYAVDEEIVRMYETAPVDQRFNLEKSLGIYKILSARLDSDRADALFDQDYKNMNPKGQPALALGNFYRGTAMVKFEVGKFSEAEDLMKSAVKHQNTEDKWRRLGEFATANDDAQAAIKYYETAHEMEPLKPPSALALAKLLVTAGDHSAALPFIETFRDIFPKAAVDLTEKIDVSSPNAQTD